MLGRQVTRQGGRVFPWFSLVRIGIAVLCVSAATSSLRAVEVEQPKELARDLLLSKITRGTARFPEIRQALSRPDVGALCNILHAMHSMRGQRASMRLLRALWKEDTALPDRYPELAWSALGKVPVRLALASTLLRVGAPDPGQYLKYLLQHKYDTHEFHRAQVVIALGLHGNPDDVDYLLEMAGGEDPYVVQSAITGLGLMRSPKARQGLGTLWKSHRDTPRGTLIEEVLLHVYRVVPKVREEVDADVADP